MEHPERQLRLSRPMAAAILALFDEPDLRATGLRAADARRWGTTAAALKKLVAFDLAYAASGERIFLTDEAVRMAERYQKRKLDYMRDAVSGLESHHRKSPREMDTEMYAGWRVRYSPDPLVTGPMPPRGAFGTVQGGAVSPSGRECLYVQWDQFQVGRRVYRLHPSLHHWEDLRLVRT